MVESLGFNFLVSLLAFLVGSVGFLAEEDLVVGPKEFCLFDIRIKGVLFMCLAFSVRIS